MPIYLIDLRTVKFQPSHISNSLILSFLGIFFFLTEPKHAPTPPYTSYSQPHALRISWNMPLSRAFKMETGLLLLTAVSYLFQIRPL